MKTTPFILSFAALLFISLSCTQQTKPPHVVIIGLDGLSVEGLKSARTPNLDSLLSNGVLSQKTRSVMPSVTLPNWTSHLTSGGPEQHGVTDNSWTIEKHQLPPIEQDSLGYYPSIFKVLKEQVPEVKTAYYYNWGNLINSMNKTYLDEVSFSEDDGYKENYAKSVDFLVKNQAKPALVFLYSVHTDHAGHAHSWMSPEYITAIEEADVEIGKFISKMKAGNLYDRTHFLLITDHGGTRESGHGGLSTEEMEVPWGITGPGVVRNQLLEAPNSNANTAAVIATIFGCEDTPKSWIGKVPAGVFE